MSDLVSRVLAAITETERIAQEACDGPWHVNDAGYAEAVYSDDGTVVIGGGRWGGEASVFDSTEDALHIARNDPAAVLRRTQADKRVLERHTPFLLTRTRLECAHCAEASPCPDLTDLSDRYGISVEEETTGE